MTINRELIRQCAENDRKAQHELYRLCYATLMSICSRYYVNNEDARATLNLGFLKILQSLKSNHSIIESFEAWIKKLMINTVIDEHRKNKSYKMSVQLHDNESSYENQDENIDWNLAEKKLEAETLIKMIRKLPNQEAKVFNLYAIDGYKHNEISDLLQIPVGTSKWLLSEARRKLRNEVESALNSKVVLK